MKCSNKFRLLSSLHRIRTGSHQPCCAMDSRSRPLPTTVTKVRKPTKHATLNLPRGKNHIHLGLLGEPMAQNLPFLVGVGEAKLEAPNEHGQQLDDFHHGDVASDASAGAGAELEKIISLISV